jgi:hypothetical protein
MLNESITHAYASDEYKDVKRHTISVSIAN